MTVRKPNPIHAFSMIELLIVIAIIAIIAAILLPTLAGAKARAQQTACMNNLKQINVGIHLYADENGDTLPNVGSPTYITYREAVKSQVGVNGPSSPQGRVFACPADTFYYDENTGALVASGRHQAAKYDYASYSFNGANLLTNYANMAYYGALPGIGGQKISAVKNSDQTALVFEAPAMFPYSWHRPQSASAQGYPIFNNARDIVSYVDGHADYIKIYWNGALSYPNGQSLAVYYDPPSGYNYEWSGK